MINSINAVIALLLSFLVGQAWADGNPKGQDGASPSTGSVEGNTSSSSENSTSGNFTTSGGKHGGEKHAEWGGSTNYYFYTYLQVTFSGIIILFMAYYLVAFVGRYLRKLISLGNNRQGYFAVPNETYAWFKEHLLYAPIWRKRHNREIRLSTASNFGTLPSRFQAVFLLAYLATNLALCLVYIDWNGGPEVVFRTLRVRTGVLAAGNMLPLFLLAFRNSPLLWVGISFDSCNLIHRWFGRVVVVETVLHTLAWFLWEVQSVGWEGVRKGLNNGMMIGGLFGTAAFVVMILHSPSVLRHAFYETFLHVHILMALLGLAGLYLHVKELPQQPLVLVLIGLWGAERLIRVARIVYRNVGQGGSHALLRKMPGEAVRVTLDLARPWAFKPGQHVYLYIPSVGGFTSHPFTVAWSEDKEDKKKMHGEKGGLAQTRQDIAELQKTNLSLLIRRRTGFTEKLYRKVEEAPNGTVAVRAMVEGPYGGVDLLHSYGTVMLFAAGIGITHQVPHVRDLLAGFSSQTVATRKIVLVWIIQSPEHLEWIREWMTVILAMESRREVLKVLLFITRPRTPTQIQSPSTSVQMIPGRPDVDHLIEEEMKSQVGAMAVSVCGTGSLGDDVRLAVRKRQSRANIDFVEEAFTW